MSNFRRLVSRFLTQVNKYRKIKSDPEAQPISKSFGVRSIIFSVFTVLTSFTIFLYNPSFMETNILLGILVILTVATFALIGPLLCFAQSLMSAIFQLRINKKPIGWVALALSIVSVIAAVFVIVTVFDSL